jgi:NAD(P)-dependent dehydrogenase (short-subunit alcohol dehydrogenase family)
MRLKDKVILVVGAGEHLGRSAPLLFAQEGARVLLVARREHVLQETVGMIERQGGTASYFCGTAANKEDVEGMIAACLERYGRLDALYNNIGGGWVELDHRLHEMSQDAYDQILASNLTAVFNTSVAAVKQFLKQGAGGAIVNVSASKVVRRMANPVYAYTKAGMIEFTRNLANDYHADGIRVNCLLPGLFVYTPVKEPVVKPLPTNLIRTQPKTARQGDPADLAYAAAFLLSDEASFITGQSFSVDGGDDVKLTDLVLD